MGKAHAFLAILLAAAAGARADSPLYETGPSQDASFVRFLNATDAEVTVAAAKGSYRLPLPPRGEARVSKFHPAIGGKKLLASVHAAGKTLPVEVTAKPGEYVTVVVTGGAAPEIRLIREAPSDYSASRASIALAIADPACADGTLTGGTANVVIFEGVKPWEVKRRLLNPVKVGAQLSCAGGAAGPALPIDFGTLQPGERVTAFVLPQGKTHAALVVRDATL